MRASKLTTRTISEDEVFYVGTTETLAKEAPVKGLKPVVVMSDVYPGYFAFSESNGGSSRWGIIEIDTFNLAVDYFAPFHGYTEKVGRRKKPSGIEEISQRRNEYFKNAEEYKDRWEKSLDSCGVVLYLAHIPSYAITQVTIYGPMDEGANSFITEESAKANPWETTSLKHRKSYCFNESITRWLACKTPKANDNINQYLQNRLAVDIYYRREEKELPGWRKKFYKSRFNRQ